MKHRPEMFVALLSIGLMLVASVFGQAPKPAAVPVPAEEAGEKGGRVEGEKAAPAVASKPVPEVKEPESVVEEKPAAEKRVAESHPENEVDEIDFESFDDSAVAAKGRPVVKLATGEGEKDGRVEGEKEKGGRVEGEKGGSKEETSTNAVARATGAEIAAKYLASNESALVDIVSDDATLADILRQFRKATGANIIYAESSNLMQRVSVSLVHVPWLQAMTSILNSRGFRVETSSGIHFVREDKLKDPTFTRSFVLNHASADELAKLFNESYGVKAPDGKLLRGIATAFQGANAVVVTASERILADCEKIVSSVDKAVPQIYIEARFIELSNEALHKLGVQWNQLESWGAKVNKLNGDMGYDNARAKGLTISSDKGLTTKGTSASSRSSENQSGFENGSSIGKNISSLTDTYSSSLERTFKSGRVSESTTDSSYSRGFSGQLSVDDFKLAMSAFESMSDARIFSNPKIIVSNGKEAKVDMTTKFPNVKIQATRNTSNGSDALDISTQLEVIPGEDKLLFAKEAFFSWGISLSVKPRISPDGLISVEIIPQISQLDTSVQMDNNQEPNGFVQVKGGDSSAMSYYPVIEVKRLTTDFTMKDGATAVIGGLSKTTEGDVDSGIPYLREIPGIGPKLFGWKSRGKVQKEILVFVTVGIADPVELEKDIGLPKNAVMGREYVEGRLLEPGDRPNAAASLSELDMRPVDKRHPKDDKAKTEEKKPEPEQRGTVTITPVEAAVSPSVPVRGIEMLRDDKPTAEPGKVSISPVI